LSALRNLCSLFSFICFDTVKTEFNTPQLWSCSTVQFDLRDIVAISLCEPQNWSFSMERCTFLQCGHEYYERMIWYFHHAG
jgi:hypothetical protein